MFQEEAGMTSHAVTHPHALRALVANESVYPADQPAAAARFEGIVGRSPALLAALRAVHQVAPTDASVLITGESGTGKELVARAIHRASRRRDGALVKVNCAAVPAALIESEFFGHERGAFTGATGRREGRFTLADRGTILLDEIGELPLELQAKLLRVLQEGEFEPVGSSRTRRVNVRVVAATNRDLAAEVRAGRFREDLFYRLNVFPVHLPPLRERSGDIPLLVRALVESLARQLERQFAPPSRECLRRLEEYDWPGNVRELHNVVERAVIAAQGDRLDLAAALPQPDALGQRYVPTGAVRRLLTARELGDIERANLMLALDLANGRVSGPGGAAQLLGINPSTLASRIKALRIERRPRPGPGTDAPDTVNRTTHEARYA
jgi:transcriptional regulator with GAF, ATPase, and Fis domain